MSNAAPISFSRCLSSDPGIPLLRLEICENGRFRDTADNIPARGKFCVNMVGNDMFEAISACAAPKAPEVDEIALVGLTPIDCAPISAMLLAEAPVTFE